MQARPGRQQLEPAAADAVRAYAARTRENADQLAAVLEDIAAHASSPRRTARRGRTCAKSTLPGWPVSAGRRLMTHQHGPRRARVTFSDAAAKQLETLISETEFHALDRALVVVSVDPDIGEPLPADSIAPQLCQYTDEIERVRLLYWVTALRTIIVVAYIEV